MGELLDRGMQRDLLKAIADGYPALVNAAKLEGIAPGNALRVNAAYLADHGLIDAKFYDVIGYGPHFLSAKITAKGIDFLADDGGLSAILGVVTVKLHEDTLKQLVAAKIQDSDLAPADKQKYLDQLRELPGETTKHLVLKLVDAGLENWQKALPLLQNMLG